jgi:hypothetical protein
VDETRGLRLAAHDEEDLRALSAAAQDAVAHVGDLSYDPRSRVFTLMLNRYRWEAAERRERVRAALRIDAVLRAQTRGVSRDRRDAVVSLLAVTFTPDAEPPGGVLTLVLAGGGEIKLTVECIDATLIDVARPWRARGRPRHDDENPSGGA